MPIPLQPHPQPLGHHEVHVWRLPLPYDGGDLSPLLALLPEPEQLRAARFYNDRHRAGYVQAHAVLRRLLGGYLGIGSYTLPFLIGLHGKPRLHHPERLRFNLAHSEDLALIAVCEGSEVGVDLELLTERYRMDQVVARFFSLPEQQAIAALTLEQRRTAFFHIWSQKEAYAKGRGDGVPLGLDHFDVEADPARPAALLADRRDPEAIAHWKLYSVDAGPRFRAALAVETHDMKVRCFDWPPTDDLSPE